MRRSSTFDSMPQFSHRDRRHLKLFFRVLGNPSFQVKCALFPSDDHTRIQDYRHLSPGVTNRLLPTTRSLCHARASSGEISVFSIALASSRPVQTFSSAGMSWANGFPFFNNRKDIF